MQRPAASTRLPDAALLVVAAMWGASYLATKTVADDLPATVVLALRFLPSAALIALYAAVTGVRPTARGTLRIGLVLGALQAITLLLETHGVAQTSAANAGVIISLAILLAPMAESRLAGRALPASFYAAAAVALVGVVVIIGAHGFSSPNLGDLLMLLAACSRSVLVVVSARLVSTGSTGAPSIIALSVIQNAFNAILFTALDPIGLVHATHALTADQWVAIGFLGIGCTLAAFGLQLWAISRTSASRASLLMGTEPVWAVAAGCLLGGELLTPLTVAGSALVVAATFTGQRIETRWRVTGDSGCQRQNTNSAHPYEATAPETPESSKIQ